MQKTADIAKRTEEISTELATHIKDVRKLMTDREKFAKVEADRVEAEKVAEQAIKDKKKKVRH